LSQENPHYILTTGKFSHPNHLPSKNIRVFFFNYLFNETYYTSITATNQELHVSTET